ncbi:MAG: GNAT family protein [Candidatus Thiodiazotropha sp.]|jgi:[ribosomal protein S5]-alanine N-acetyltransferase
MNFPEISTDRLRLNEIGEDDAKALFQHFSNKEVVEFYDLEAFEQLEQAQKLIALFKQRFDDALGIRWAIRMKNSDRFIGTCGFNSWNQRMKSTVIGYDISREFWGHGYATEAIHGIVNAAFSGDLPCGRINRIQADTLPGNFASEAVLSKVGFKEEGLLRESGYWKGRYHDLKCFGLIRSEYRI